MPSPTTYSLRTTMQRELARGAFSYGVLAEKTGVDIVRLRRFAAAHADLLPDEAAKLAQVLGVKAGDAEPLWTAAVPFQPDALAVRITAGHVEVGIVKRGQVVRTFTGRTVAAVAREIERVAA